MTLAARPCLRCGQSVYPFTRTLRREFFPTRYYDTTTGEQHVCPGIDWSLPYWAAQAGQAEAALAAALESALPTPRPPRARRARRKPPAPPMLRGVLEL